MYKLKLNFTVKEFGVFLLLLFLNIKFTTILITHNRNIIVDAIVYLLFVITFNYSNWTYKSLIKTVLIIGVYTLINFSSYKLNVLMPLLVIQSVSGIRFKRYLCINFIIAGGFLLIMYVVYGDGINMSMNDFGVERKTRMNFGFNTPNVASLHYFCIIINGLLLVYFFKPLKHVFYYLLLIIPLWFYIYKQTDSRSFLLSIVVLYGSLFFYSVQNYFNKKLLLRLINYIFIFLIYILSILTVFIALTRDYFLSVDRLFSKRPTFYNWFLHTLTPQDFFFGTVTFEHYVIDSSYLRLMFEGGIIFFAVVSIFYVKAATKMVNQKVWIPICVIFSFMAYGLMESSLLYSMLIGTNIYWITLYYYYKNGKMSL